MKAYVILYCLEGFGDQYSNIITGYKACQDLIILGYQVEVVWVNRNLYFSSELPLDIIYDFTPFQQIGINISYIKTEKELPHNLKFVESKQSAIKIFVNYIIENLVNYELPVYDIFGFYRNSVSEYNEKKLPKFTNQFINQDIINLSNKICTEEKLKAIHIRTTDTLNNSTFDDLIKDDFFKNRIEKSFQFIEKNTKEKVIILSSNKDIKKYYSQHFPNVIFNTFTNDLPLHHSYNRKVDENINVNHAKEILAEMIILSKCDKIFTISRNLSNFLTYGIFHNKYHRDWKNKFIDLIEN